MENSNKNFAFTYNSENFGIVVVEHDNRDEEAEKDSFNISAEKGALLGTIIIPFETKPANALKLIFDAIEAIDYKGE